MTTLAKPIQGVLNIDNIQGNYRQVILRAKKRDGTLIDLTQYDKIRMEIKEANNVNEKPFIVFEVGSGFVISGSDNHILTFVLDERFWEMQVSKWVYDMVFLKTGQRSTLIKGKIINDLTVSSV